MPRMKGETDQEWMQRLRRIRGVDRSEMFLKAEAALTYSRTASNPEKQKELELRGFMSVFHPGYSEAVIKRMLSETE